MYRQTALFSRATRNFSVKPITTQSFATNAKTHFFTTTPRPGCTASGRNQTVSIAPPGRPTSSDQLTTCKEHVWHQQDQHAKAEQLEMEELRKREEARERDEESRRRETAYDIGSDNMLDGIHHVKIVHSYMFKDDFGCLGGMHEGDGSSSGVVASSYEKSGEDSGC